jgi:hypothetical protein
LLRVKEGGMDIKKVLSLSLDTSSKAYSKQPIPSELDLALIELVDAFRKANPLRRFLIKRRVSDQHSAILWVFSERMASLAVRERSTDRVLQGLSGLALEGCQEDYRDCVIRLAPLYDAALKIGASPNELFKKAASYGSGEAGKLILNYLKRTPENLTLGAMGYSEGETEDGFRYIHKYFG